MGIIDTVPNLMEAIAKVNMELAIVEDNDYKKLYELEHEKAMLYARLAALHQKNHIQDLIIFNAKANEWKVRLKLINDKLEYAKTEKAFTEYKNSIAKKDLE